MATADRQKKSRGSANYSIDDAVEEAEELDLEFAGFDVIRGLMDAKELEKLFLEEFLIIDEGRRGEYKVKNLAESGKEAIFKIAGSEINLNGSENWEDPYGDVMDDIIGQINLEMNYLGGRDKFAEDVMKKYLKSCREDFRKDEIELGRTGWWDSFSNRVKTAGKTLDILDGVYGGFISAELASEENKAVETVFEKGRVDFDLECSPDQADQDAVYFLNVLSNGEWGPEIADRSRSYETVHALDFYFDKIHAGIFGEYMGSGNNSEAHVWSEEANKTVEKLEDIFGAIENVETVKDKDFEPGDKILIDYGNQKHTVRTPTDKTVQEIYDGADIFRKVAKNQWTLQDVSLNASDDAIIGLCDYFKRRNRSIEFDTAINSERGKLGKDQLMEYHWARNKDELDIDEYLETTVSLLDKMHENEGLRLKDLHIHYKNEQEDVLTERTLNGTPRDLEQIELVSPGLQGLISTDEVMALERDDILEYNFRRTGDPEMVDVNSYVGSAVKLLDRLHRKGKDSLELQEVHEIQSSDTGNYLTHRAPNGTPEI